MRMDKCVRRLSKVEFPRNCEKIELSNYQLHKEIDRRRSFVDNTWYNPFVRFEDLALTGFFFFKKPDHVKCFFCSVHLSDFEPNDDIVKEHLKFSPNCPLIRRRQTHNFTSNHKELDRILPVASFDECGSTRKKSRVEDKVSYPEYRLASERLKTFHLWPVSIELRPDDLAAAGFFYTGQSDITVCFSCGAVVVKWEKGDNAWIEHKKFQKNQCSFLKLNHEQLKINEKKQKTTLSQEKCCESKEKSEESAKEAEFETCCKICYSQRSSIVFLPCKHVAVCGSCVFSIDDKCPICRATIEEKYPLFYS